MSEEYQNQLFRLSAVLYADNNYEVKPITIHKKIIESALLECTLKECSIHDIINFIQDNYKIIFEEDDLKNIVTSDKDRFFTNNRNGILFICLNEKRKQTLLSKIETKNIDYFIDEFINTHTAFNANIDVKPLIHNFLYEIFISNTSSFQKLINRNKELIESINIESTNYTENEKDTINQFLQWDNPNKNKAIFNISSYALEYCMLTNKNGSSSIQLDNLKNKIFYLDTNIIYRTLGINGEDRKQRSRTFLRKFNEAGEKLFISKSTDIEFREGIKTHIKRIEKYNSPRINSKVYQEINVQQDIFNFYHNWRIGKVNCNIELFSAEILSLYDKFREKFKIEIDSQIPYDLEQKNIKEVLGNYNSKISQFKSNEGHDIIGSSAIDAENILWIETKRENKNQNIFDTKYFLISTDQGLRRWDYQRTNLTPTVILPSQWLSILLRYLERTDDDFKSFVNFLNLKNNEVLITSEKLHIVLSGISEMTEDIIQQKTLLNNLIEIKFNGVLSKDTDYNAIYENAKKYAKSELEKIVEELSKQNEEIRKNQNRLDNELKEHKEIYTHELSNLKRDNEGVSKQLTESETENQILKDKLIKQEVDKRFNKWQRTAYLLLGLCVLIIFCIILMFSFESWEYNYPNRFIKWIDSLKSVAQSTIVIGIIISLIIGFKKIIIIPCRKLFDKEYITKKKEEIESEVEKNDPNKNAK